MNDAVLLLIICHYILGIRSDLNRFQRRLESPPSPPSNVVIPSWNLITHSG